MNLNERPAKKEPDILQNFFLCIKQDKMRFIMDIFET
jgi:hypothetical protein